MQTPSAFVMAGFLVEMTEWIGVRLWSLLSSIIYRLISPEYLHGMIKIPNNI